MKIAWLGTGKLGSVCAAVLAKHGHDVIGYDPYSNGVIPSYEVGTEGLEKIEQVENLSELPIDVEVFFVSVQTPHSKDYDGTVPVPEETRDFEYAYLAQACREVFRLLEDREVETTVVIVSTVLPGTFNKYIRAMKPINVNIIYNPFFIAMSTTVHDFENPEFVLLGVDNPDHAVIAQKLYSEVHDKPTYVTTIENAELIKVAYNTFISMKIVWANAMMEICHKTGADCDVVVDALSQATDRVISPKYMKGGVGDSGHCHPRDLIAMSNLAKQLNLSFDLMGALAQARDIQSQWLVDLACYWQDLTGLPLVLLGKAYKPGVSLTGGSVSILMNEQFKQTNRSVLFTLDPYTDPSDYVIPAQPMVFVVVTAHTQFAEEKFSKGSVVIDPHGYIPDQTGVTVIRVGRKS